MKSIMHSGIAFVVCFLALGLTAFAPENAQRQNEETTSCYIYRADLTTAKWNEIAGPHGYTQYIVLDADSFSSPDHVISTSDYNGDWEALMNCLGLPTSTESIIIEEDLGGT